jgi:hypothetical protein
MTKVVKSKWSRKLDEDYGANYSFKYVCPICIKVA